MDKNQSKNAEQRINSKIEFLNQNYSEEGIKFLREKFYYPVGSGPLGTMAMICACLDKIAELESWKIKDEK